MPSMLSRDRFFLTRKSKWEAVVARYRPPIIPIFRHHRTNLSVDSLPFRATLDARKFSSEIESAVLDAASGRGGTGSGGLIREWWAARSDSLSHSLPSLAPFSPLAVPPLRSPPSLLFSSCSSFHGWPHSYVRTSADSVGSHGRDREEFFRVWKHGNQCNCFWRGGTISILAYYISVCKRIYIYVSCQVQSYRAPTFFSRKWW